MTNRYLPPSIFIEKSLDKCKEILVIGYNEGLIHTLSKGAVVLDPSLSKTHLGHNTLPENTFLTKDLSTFFLDKKFQTIVSLNTLHLHKDLHLILRQIQKHLLEEATLYFPLAPDPRITTFLELKEWSSYTKEASFQIRSRADVEDAALFAPFITTMIEEKNEYLPFYSKESLGAYLYEQLDLLTDLTDYKLDKAIKELIELFYMNHDEDQVLTVATPWVLLTLSNDPDIL